VVVADPSFILKNLERPELLQAFATETHLLRALIHWNFTDFERLELKLHQLGHSKLLSLLQLDAIRWNEFDRFTPVQKEVAAALLHRHKKLPAELVESVSAGRIQSASLLEFWEAYPPSKFDCQGLAQLLVRSNPEDQAALREALFRKGNSAIHAFSKLLQDPDPQIAERAALEFAQLKQELDSTRPP